MLRLLAVSAEPLTADRLYSFGPIDITNSMLYGVITAAVLLVVLISAAKLSQLHPMSRLAYYVELLVDSIWGVAMDSFGSRKRALKHLPLLVALFVFILAWNLSGLIPGVGSITATVEGEEVSLLRAFTTDLNATLALAILTIGTVQFYALKELGLKGHFKHYFSDKPWKPGNFLLGMMEVFSDVLRIVTLSMRLFGVIYAGEVLIHTIAQLTGNLAWFATVPVIFLEIFFSTIQAYVFMMLTTTYLAMATAHEDSHEEVEVVSSKQSKNLSPAHS